MRVTLGDVCEKGASNLKQSDVVNMILFMVLLVILETLTFTIKKSHMLQS